MPDESGFEIKGRFYPLPVSFRLGDPVLVEKVTDLDWPTFTERLPDEDSDPSAAEDIVVLTGLLAVSVWQEHPHWRRERVAKYVEQIDMETVKFVAADEPEEEEDEEERPPEEAATEPGAQSSAISPPLSSDTPVSPSEPSSPSSSGTATSDTGSPEPALPAE